MGSAAPLPIVARAREGPQLVEDLVARDGVEARRSLVKDQQLRAVREGNRQLQLHAHAAGEVADLGFGEDPRSRREVIEGRLVPVGVRGGHAGHDLGNRVVARERTGVEHHANA